MPKIEAAAAALSLLTLAACESRQPPAANNEVQNEAVEPETKTPPDRGPDNGASEPAGDAVPPPDAVSHPQGYLPPSAEPPAPSGAEPPADPPSLARDRPPATEDEYIRNGERGG